MINVSRWNMKLQYVYLKKTPDGYCVRYSIMYLDDEICLSRKIKFIANENRKYA